MTNSTGLLAPHDAITPEEHAQGVRMMVGEAGLSSAATALTSGVILTAFALHLGASNFEVGLLASAPFFGQLLQGPAIVLIERLRRRKLITLVVMLLVRLLLAGMALAVFLPRDLALALVVLAQCAICGLNAFATCAWNGWVRDFLHDRQMGDIFARRTVYATFVSIAAGLIAAFTLDQPGADDRLQNLVYAFLYGAGCLAGLVSITMVARIPEPRMPEPTERVRLLPLLRAPFADANFRRLIVFLAAWQFAANFATPFFMVYFIDQLNFDIATVMLLSVVSQAANLLALRNWGRLSDLFANKSVLAVTAPTYIACIVAMVGASQIANPHWLTAYLVLLHVLMGLAVAGVTLAVANITLRLSPRGNATAYVASSALVSSFAAGIAPLIGGAFADFFAVRRFELIWRWTSPDLVMTAWPLTLSGWDFYFLIAGLFGLYALHRLALVTEEGEIEGRAMIQQWLHQTRRSVRNISTVAGFRASTELPASLSSEEEDEQPALARPATAGP